MILDKLKANLFWIYVISMLVGALASFGFAGYQMWQMQKLRAAGAEERQKWAEERAKQSQDLAKAQAAARSAEAGLQAGAAEIRKETNDQVRSLAAHRDALVRRLRVAESNLATARLVSETTAAARAGQAAGGGGRPELPASIGEADVAEAERADVIRLHLAACYAQYDRAQEALKGLGARSGQ